MTGWMRLDLDDAIAIVQHGPMFRIKRKELLASLSAEIELRPSF